MAISREELGQGKTLTSIEALQQETQKPVAYPIGYIYLQPEDTRSGQFIPGIPTMSFNAATIIGDTHFTMATRICAALTLEEQCRLRGIPVPDNPKDRRVLHDVNRRERGVSSHVIGFSAPLAFAYQGINIADLPHMPDTRVFRFVPQEQLQEGQIRMEEDPRMTRRRIDGVESLVASCVTFDGFFIDPETKDRRHKVSICLHHSPWQETGPDTTTLPLTRIAGGFDPQTGEYMGSFKNPSVPERDNDRWVLLMRGMQAGDEKRIYIAVSEDQQIDSYYRPYGILPGIEPLLVGIPNVRRIAIASNEIPFAIEELFTKEQLHMLQVLHPQVLWKLQQLQFKGRLMHYVQHQRKGPRQKEYESYRCGLLITSEARTGKMRDTLQAVALIQDIIGPDNYSPEIQALLDIHERMTGSRTLLPDKDIISGAVGSLQRTHNPGTGKESLVISGAVADLYQENYMVDYAQLANYVGVQILKEALDNLRPAA